jgi:hypothetical protein
VLSANVPFGAALPGGAWLDRGPDTPTGYPYAVYRVEAQPTDLAFDDAYLGRFTCTIAAYVPLDATAPPRDTPDVQQAIFTALVTDSANDAFMGLALRNPTEGIRASKTKNPEGKYDPTMRNGRDVFMSGLTWEITVQGDRSIS